jgi:hypothetical protein
MRKEWQAFFVAKQTVIELGLKIEDRGRVEKPP